MGERRREAAGPNDVDRVGSPSASWGFRMTYAPGSRRGIVRTTPDLTMHFLDICALDVTKRTKAQIAADPRKAAMARKLEALDIPTNRISSFLALMEKTSDTRSTRTDEDLKAQIIGDIQHTRSFFDHAEVVERDEFVEDYITQLRRIAVELGRPAYLAFLRAANDGDFGIHQPIPKPQRFEVASTLVQIADDLKISRQHPVLAVTLACLYGNASARRVLKFRPDPAAFDAENALADVMTIRRFMDRRLELERDYHLGLTSIRHSAYVTDDGGLEQVMSCFHGMALSTREAGDHQEVLVSGKVDFADLLTEISHEPGPITDSTDAASVRPSEYDRLCALILRQQPCGGNATRAMA